MIRAPDPARGGKQGQRVRKIRSLIKPLHDTGHLVNYAAEEEVMEAKGLGFNGELLSLLRTDADLEHDAARRARQRPRRLPAG